MIKECRILLGVQHLKQGTCRITIMPSADFVDFVNENKRVLSADALQGLYNFARECATTDNSGISAMTRLHGAYPTYVLLCPLISATSVNPPTENLKNCRLRARAMDLPMDVFPTPGGPTRQMILPSTVPRSFPTARNSRIRSLTSFSP